MRSLLVLGVSLLVSVQPARAQSWSWAADGVSIPASVSGSKVPGAKMTCVDDAYFLALDETQIGDGTSVVPVALLVDRSVFATSADGEGVISVPAKAVEAVKTGNRLTVSFDTGGKNFETTFALRGSAKALEALAANCGTAAPEQPAEAPEAAAELSLDFAESTPAGSKLEIAFVGPRGEGDWIGIVPPGSRASFWISGSYVYASETSPVSIDVPDAFGRFEVRYVTKANAVLLAKPVQVTGGAAFVSAPDKATGASMLTVEFGGPGSEAAFVAIARAGEPGGSAISRTTAFHSPVTLRAPVAGGAYEVRFVAEGATIAASKALAVDSAPVVTLTATKAAPGAAVEVQLADAPRVGGDYIYIAKPGTPDADYAGGYFTVPTAGPVAITAPKESGAWELRYVVPEAGTYIALGRAELSVE